MYFFSEIKLHLLYILKKIDKNVLHDIKSMEGKKKKFLKNENKCEEKNSIYIYKVPYNIQYL